MLGGILQDALTVRANARSKSAARWDIFCAQDSASMSSYNNLPVTGFPAKSPDIPDNLTLALAACQDVSVVRASPEIGVSVSAVLHVAEPSCWSRGGGGSPKGSNRYSTLHTPSKNPVPVSRMQAYIAYPLGRDVRRSSQRALGDGIMLVVERVRARRVCLGRVRKEVG
jgi:hypothetical protein